MSPGPEQDWGLVGGHGSGSAILVPSWCHLVPGEQGPHGRAAATHSAMGNEGKINFHCTFFQSRVGLWSVPSPLAHWHPPLMLLLVPRAPTKPCLEWQQCQGQRDRSPRRAHSQRAGKSHSRAAVVVPSTPSQGSPGMWQLGFCRQHTMDLWVLGRWKLQQFALGEWAKTH